MNQYNNSKLNRIELDFYDLEYITNKESDFKSI